MSKYFVSFTYQNPGHTGARNAEVGINGGIRSFDDIAAIENQFCSDLGYKNAIIQNYIELMPVSNCDEDSITEAKSETKEEILTYLRDCAENIGCPASESRALNKAADNIEKYIEISESNTNQRDVRS